MKNAYEYREEFSLDGKRLVKRERTVGGIVVWGFVAVIAILSGYALFPASFWAFFK